MFPCTGEFRGWSWKVMPLECWAFELKDNVPLHRWRCKAFLTANKEDGRLKFKVSLNVSSFFPDHVQLHFYCSVGTLTGREVNYGKDFPRILLEKSEERKGRREGKKMKNDLVGEKRHSRSKQWHWPLTKVMTLARSESKARNRFCTLFKAPT